MRARSGRGTRLTLTVLKTSIAEVILHGRLRIGRGTLQQGRTGVITRFRIPGDATLIGGYYYGKEEDGAEDWRNFHRLFIGIEVPLYRGLGLRLDTRGIVERFFVVDSPAVQSLPPSSPAALRAPPRSLRCERVVLRRAWISQWPVRRRNPLEVRGVRRVGDWLSVRCPPPDHWRAAPRDRYPSHSRSALGRAGQAVGRSSSHPHNA